MSNLQVDCHQYVNKEHVLNSYFGLYTCMSKRKYFYCTLNVQDTKINSLQPLGLNSNGPMILLRNSRVFELSGILVVDHLHISNFDSKIILFT